MWKQSIILGIQRAWIAFVTVSLPVTGLWSALGGGNLMKSDDPYIIGSVFGGTGAVAGLLYTTLEALSKSRRTLVSGYFSAIIGWSGFLLGVGLFVIDNEGGNEIALYASVPSMLTGIVAFALFQCQLSNRWIMTIIAVGLIYVGVFAWIDISKPYLNG